MTAGVQHGDRQRMHAGFPPFFQGGLGDFYTLRQRQNCHRGQPFGYGEGRGTRREAALPAGIRRWPLAAVQREDLGPVIDRKIFSSNMTSHFAASGVNSVPPALARSSPCAGEPLTSAINQLRPSSVSK